MPLISKFKDIFKGGSNAKRKKVFHNVQLDNPEEVWEIIGELGDGAYGKVYKAMHKESRQLAALKQVQLEADEDLETFMIEIDILAEFKHVNVVKLLEAYHYDGHLWMYLEYCDGGAVDSIMRDLDRPLSEAQIAFICRELCEALTYIHENKVIHRDMKAGNVLLTMEGGVKLADFGVSAKNKNTYDKRGTFIGTPYWLAPEVILCETFIDAKYDYKADVWSLGISLIEFAQMDPPNHEVSPVRVMLKIQKSDPPKLDYPSRYSKDFNDFIAKCLTKDPALRPTATELLKHPFISRKMDVKVIRDLLLEYKAEVVEEEVLEDPDDPRTSRNSESEHSPDDALSIASTNTLSKDQESICEDKQSVCDESKPPTYDEAMVQLAAGERRMSKGPAPPPPISISGASTPSSSSASSTPSKKKPAPAVPQSTNTTKPSMPSPDSVEEDTIVSIPSVTTPNKQITSTPSGKGPAPKPSPPAESPVTKDKTAIAASTKDIPNSELESSSLSISDMAESGQQQLDSSVPAEPELLINEKSDTIESVNKEPKINSNNKDISDEKLIHDKMLLSKEDEKPSPVHMDNGDINFSPLLLEDAEPLTPPPFFKDSSAPSSPKVVESVDKEELQEKGADKSLPSSEPELDNIESKVFSLPSPPDSSPTSQLSPVHHSSASDSISEDLVPNDQVNDSSSSGIVIPQNLSSLSPEPAETIIASIGTDATVIVRTPTPTPPEASKAQTPVKKESVVTYSGPAIVDEDEPSKSTEMEQESSTVQQPVTLSTSLTEAEEQAVRILESAINSAETTSTKSSQDEGEDVTLTGTSVILSPEKGDETDSQVVDQEKEISVSEDVSNVEVPANDGHKLDESEVVILGNSSVLQDDSDPATDNSMKTRYEITLEEVGEAEDTPSSITSDSDTTHISVVAVDDLEQSKKRAAAAAAEISNTTTSGTQTINSDTQNESDRTAQEKGTSPVTALKIEGTTVEATDVDGDFDQEQNIKNLKDSQQTPRDRPVLTRDSTVDSVISAEFAGRPTLARESTIDSVVSVDSVISTMSTFSTPGHTNLPSVASTSISSESHGTTKVVPNGIGKDSHRPPDKCEWDNISTTSSDKENKPRSENDENSESVVYRRTPMSDRSDTSLRSGNKENRPMTKEEMERNAHRRKTRKRTRKFVIDGVVVTTTTSKVIYGDDEEMDDTSQVHLARKQELRELKLLQKIEQKQFQELATKANFAKQEQEKKFDAEKQQLLRGYDTEVEALNRQQKQQVEKAEAQQEVELKNASKKIRAEQERELKSFRDTLKTELKLLKQEIDLLPKDKRKEAFKARKERLDVDQTEREKDFLEKLHEAHELSLKRLGDDHRERIALLERQFLQQKHQLLRSRESSLWEMEERHLHEKHQLSKRQLKDIFFLQRHQMLIRHEKELEQVKRFNHQKEEELVKRQQVEKRQLPKRIRQEMKARELMFRESMRISTSHLPDSHDDEKNRLKKFQENEKRRYEAEKRRAEQKHKHKLEELQAASEATIKELEQLQNEKRKMLMEHETYKLKSQDEEYHRDVKEWKDNLKPRKQKLEEEFEKQLNEQEQFYGAYLHRGLDTNMTPSQSTSSLARSNAS